MEAKPERLQKILAAAGLASRRKAEELIAAGRVSVNGHVITEAGSKADPRLDEIRVDGKLLRGPERHVYIAIYKPKGYMTTVSDPEGRPTVMDLLKGVEERVFPVGRLDYMSEGLLLLTNDGDLMAQLTRAGSHVAKTYMVKVSGKPSDEAIDKLRNGIMLPPEPGLTGARGKKQPGVERRSFAVLTQPAAIQLAVDQENPWYEVTLTEGRNRQLRRMFEQVGHHIEKIKRVRYGSLTLDLEPGQFRYLTPKEVNQLRKSLETPFKPKPIKPKRKTERPERKPRLDTARFVKGRRGAPAPEPAEAASERRTGRAPAAGAASFAAYSPRSAKSRPADRAAVGSVSGERRSFLAREERERRSFKREDRERRSFEPREERGAKRQRPESASFAAYPPRGERRPAGPRGPEFGGERQARPGRRDEFRAGERPFSRGAAKFGSKGTAGFEKFSKPGFDRPRKPRTEGEGEGFAGRKPFGERPFSRGAAKFGSKGAAGFEKFSKPGFDRPRKPRAEGEGEGFAGRKPFGERPYGKSRPTSGDREFSKPSASIRRFSKGPGKPGHMEEREGGDRGGFKRGARAPEAGAGFRKGPRPGGGKFGKSFGSKAGGPPAPRSGSPKRAGESKFGGGGRRPSSPARKGGAPPASRRWPGEE